MLNGTFQLTEPLGPARFYRLVNDTNAVDVPDPSFLDSNGDDIDGDIQKAIFVATPPFGAGGNGGSGGNGGAGGSGSGGSGGPSIGVCYSKSTMTLGSNSFATGAAGFGGQGGVNSVVGAAPGGAAGVSANLFFQ